MRQGHDLADILGLQQAVFGQDTRAPDSGGAGNVDPADADVQRLVAKGLAHQGDGDVSWKDARIADILGRVEDPRDYLRMMLRVSDGTAELLDGVAEAVVIALTAAMVDRWGEKYVPLPQDMVELNRMVRDYRRLANRVIATISTWRCANGWSRR